MLNPSKTEITVCALSHKAAYKEEIPINDTILTPSSYMKLLGITIDNKLTFNDHINAVVRKCNSLLFMMRKLKTIGLDTDGLKTFYTSNVKSVICYAAPSWFSFLSINNRDKLEHIQQTATRIIYPGECYTNRLMLLRIPRLTTFMFNLSQEYFNKIRGNSLHPLHSRITFNNSRRSTRANQHFRTEKCRTTKRAHSVFQYYMANQNNGFIYKDK